MIGRADGGPGCYDQRPIATCPDGSPRWFSLTACCISNGDFTAYESPELASRLAPASGTGTSSRWQVASGGRLGFVVGEDAVEGGCLP